MIQLKTLLVDDEYSAIEGLRIRLEAFDEIDVNNDILRHLNGFHDRRFACAVLIDANTKVNLVWTVIVTVCNG